VAVGQAALFNNITGAANIALGNSAGAAVDTGNFIICIGASGANVDHSCYIDNIWQQPGGSQAVFVNSEGKLGAQVSSSRFKDEIQPINQASEVIYGLRPVKFRYKPEIEPNRVVGFGLIAEEVQEINPALVGRDKEGKPYTVRYDAVNAMLLNEFLKQHKKVEQQQATIAELKSTVAQQQKNFESRLVQQERRIESLMAGLQKVSAQPEVSRPVPQMAANDR
jgi:Fe2+ transport system protein B